MYRERKGWRPGKRVAWHLRGILPFGLLCIPVESAIAQLLFSGNLSIPSRTDPVIAVADLTGDGVADLAVADGTGAVSLLVGSGDGTFSQETIVGTGRRFVWIETADLNADARLDLVLVDQGSNRISILLNRGAGGFAPQRDYQVEPQPASIAVGDLNGDQRLDLAVTAHGSLSILLGDGQGNFSRSAERSVGFASAVASGDLDGDARTDLVLLEDCGITVFLMATGGLSTPTRYRFGSCPSFVAIADLDGDHRQDVAVTDPRRNSVWVLLGHGDGTLASPSEVPAGPGPTSLVVGELNGDSKPDMAVTSRETEMVSVLLGKEGGGFELGEEVSAGHAPHRIAGADIDHDGDVDLVVANQTTLLMLSGDGNGRFGQPVEWETGLDPISVTTADVNQDGHVDLVVPDSGANTVSILIAKGDGSFWPRHAIVTNGMPSSVAAADFNADGKIDLSVLNRDSDTVSILMGAGDGTFGPRTDLATGRSPLWLAPGEFDADGILDLALSNSGSNTVWIMLGDGNGGFHFSHQIEAGQYGQLTAVELNGDGKQDLVMAGPSVLTWRGNGDGTFQEPTVHGPKSSSVAAADMDLDGKMDLVLDSYLLLGNGNGTFRRAEIPASGTPNSAKVSDLNGDRLPDLALIDENTNTVFVMLSVGRASFGPPIGFGTGRRPSSLAIADLTGDGRPDLAVSNRSANTVSVIANSTGATAADVEGLQASSTEGPLRVSSLRLSWSLPEPAIPRLTGVLVERAQSPGGSYHIRSLSPLFPSRSMSYLDSDVRPGETYWYRLRLQKDDGTSTVAGPVAGVVTWRTVFYTLPLPSSASPVTIGYQLVGTNVPVNLAVYDVRGRLVRSLDSGLRDTGEHVFQWDVHDNRGLRVASGIYFVNLRAGALNSTQRLVLLDR